VFDDNTTDKVLTLVADCTTDHTLFVPNDYTLDGDSHTITAVDPPSGHFLGAIIKNAGNLASVENLALTASNLANVCDGGDDRLRGTLFDGAEGEITNNTVTHIKQGTSGSGCQEGDGIRVQNAPFDNTASDMPVTISGNVVSDYQKNGITANGSVAATIIDNVVTGAGPVDYIAQNGIQVGFGATALVRGNAMSNNFYTPPDTEACGLLLFQADGARVSMNKYSNNEVNQCNAGKGSGKFKPSP
jgi:hypothetical protein